MRTRTVRLLAMTSAVGAIAAVAVAGAAAHDRGPRPPASACAVVRVKGDVADRLRLAVDELRAFPAHTADVTFQSGGGQQAHHYVGVLLADVIAAAGPQLDPAVKNDSLRFYASAVGADGYAAVVSFGEIDAGFGGRQALLAYEEDGVDLCSAGPRLVVPGDLRGGRYVSNVVQVEIGRAGGRDRH